MSVGAPHKLPSKVVRKVFLACQLLGLVIAAAIGYFMDHMPLRIIVPSFVIALVIVFLVRKCQRKSGALK